MSNQRLLHLRQLVAEAAESFAIWEALIYFVEDEGGYFDQRVLGYSHLFEAIQLACLRSCVVSLFILYDSGEQGDCLPILHSELNGKGKIPSDEYKAINFEIDKTAHIRKKVNYLRNNYFAHKPKNSDWVALLAEQNLTINDIKKLVKTTVDIFNHITAKANEQGYGFDILEPTLLGSLKTIRNLIIQS